MMFGKIDSRVYIDLREPRNQLVAGGLPARPVVEETGRHRVTKGAGSEA
jgi:hypothetical protein